MILLLGNGYFGSAFHAVMLARDIKHEVLTRKTFDFNLLSQYLKSSKTELVINTCGMAGKPNVDSVETNELEAFEANSLLPRRINQACLENGIPWVHISTGCIYTAKFWDGGLIYDEVATPNYTFESPPTSFYSGTKYWGELLIKENPNLYILRPRMIFDNLNSPKNYITKILNYKKVFSQVNSMTDRFDFVNATLDLWDLKAPFGTYNVVNPGHLSAREISELIKTHLKTNNSSYKNKVWEFFESEEVFLKTVKCPRSNVVLSSDKLLSTGVKMRNLEESMCWSLKNWID